MIKQIRSLANIVASAALGVFAGLAILIFTGREDIALSVMFFGGILIALFLGVFDE